MVWSIISTLITVNWNRRWIIRECGKINLNCNQCYGHAFKTIVKNLQPIYTKYFDFLKKIKKLQLCGLDNKALQDMKDVIEELFDEISSIKFVKYTSASKALYVIAPIFFVLWDLKIRRKYGIKKNNGKGYFEFLTKVKDILENIVEEYRHDKGFNDFEKAKRDLEERLGIPLTKAIDEYN